MNDRHAVTRAIGALLFILGIPMLYAYTPLGALLMVAGLLFAILGAAQQWRERAKSRSQKKCERSTG